MEGKFSPYSHLAGAATLCLYLALESQLGALPPSMGTRSQFQQRPLKENALTALKITAPVSFL